MIMSREEERLYGVSAFHVGERHYTPKNTIFKDKVEVFTDGYGKITGATNKEKLIRLSLPEDIEGISIDEIGEDSFSDCPNLEMVMLPKSIERIGANAFKNCKHLRVAAFGDRVYEIGDSAFEGCLEIEDIYFPSSLEKIGARAFYGCRDLKRIKLSNDIELGAMCFASTQSIETFECDNLKVIPDGAFISSGIKRVKLSNSIERIGISAFSRCHRLNEIYYDGSLEEFRKIFFGMNWNKDMPSSCALYLRDGSGKYYNAFKEKDYKNEEEKVHPLKEDLELLGIKSINPTLSDISKAYREKARHFHPDVLSGLDLDSAFSEFAANQFRLYTEAYDRLLDYFKKR